MRLRHFAIASLFALGAGVAVACGDDDAPADHRAGSGSLVIGDETYSFDVQSCEFGAAETGDEDVLFSLRGEGDDDLAVEVSRRFQPSVDRDPDVETIDHVFLFQDVPVGQEYAWEAFSAPEGAGVATAGGFLEIDGDRVTGTADFVDRLDEELPPVVTAGTIEATCP